MGLEPAVYMEMSEMNVRRTHQEAIDYCASYSPDGEAWRVAGISVWRNIQGAIDPVEREALGLPLSVRTASGTGRPCSYCEHQYWSINLDTGAEGRSYHMHGRYIRCTRSE